MTLKTIPLAIAYDFDGTLAPGYMQDHRFIPDLGMPRNEFWAEVNRIKARDNADPVLAYMGHMLHMAASAGVDVRRSDLRAWGADLPLFSGLPEWFFRITAFAADRGVDVRHYVISSGNTEIIEGTGLADAVELIERLRAAALGYARRSDGWSEDEATLYVEGVFEVWHRRSNEDWTLDISWAYVHIEAKAPTPGLEDL